MPGFEDFSKLITNTPTIDPATKIYNELGFGAGQNGAPYKIPGISDNPSYQLPDDVLKNLDSNGFINNIKIDQGNNKWFGNEGIFGGIGNLFSGLGNLGQVYMAYKMLDAQKDFMKQQQQQYREGMDFNKSIANNAYADTLASRNSLASADPKAHQAWKNSGTLDYRSV